MVPRFVHRESARRPEAADEALWIAAARAGDPAAFRWLVQRHYRSLWRMAVRLVRDPVEAEDLVQESLLKAYLHLDRFDPRYRASTWLHRITLNTCRDHLKSARRAERPAGSDPAPDRGAGPLPEAEALARETAAGVRLAYSRLRPSDREALAMRDVDDLTYAEILEATGTPVGAMKSRVVRARSRLRALLGRGEGGSLERTAEVSW